MIDCHYNMPPGACACDIPGPDFYDDDAQQLAASQLSPSGSSTACGST